MRAASLFLLVYTLAGAAAPATAQVELSVPYAMLEDGDRVTEPGARVTVEYAVRNGGPSEAEDVPVGFFFSSDRRFDASDVFLEDETVSLGEFETDEESEQVSLPDALAPGCYYVLVVADYTGRFAEANEDDNTAAALAAVGRTLTECGVELPDLVLTMPTITPRPINPGATVDVAVTLRNVGPRGVSGNPPAVSFYFSADGVFDGVGESREDINRLAVVPYLYVGAGQSVRVSASVRLPTELAEGTTYTIFAVADPFWKVTELDEDNNLASVTFRVSGPVVGGYPDLRIDRLTVPRTTFQPDDQVFLGYAADISNAGEAASVHSFVRALLSTDEIPSPDDLVLRPPGDFDMLRPGQEVQGRGSLSFPVCDEPAPGDYFLLVEVGSRDRDAHPEDNLRAVPVTVAPLDVLPDLSLSDGYVLTPAARPGERVEIGFTLRNRPDAFACDVDVALYLVPSGGALDVTGQVPIVRYPFALAPGDRIYTNPLVSIPDTTALGTYAVWAVADDRSRLDESDETNNALRLGDLVVGGATAGEALPGAEALSLRAWPTPARETVQLAYTLPEPGPARLTVFDALGRSVVVVTDGPQAAGAHTARLDARALVPGLYVARLVTVAGLASVTFTVVR